MPLLGWPVLEEILQLSFSLCKFCALRHRKLQLFLLHLWRLRLTLRSLVPAVFISLCWCPSRLPCLWSSAWMRWELPTAQVSGVAPASSSSCRGCLRSWEPHRHLQLCPPKSLWASGSQNFPASQEAGWGCTCHPSDSRGNCSSWGWRTLLLPAPPPPVPLLSFPCLPGYWSHITQPCCSSLRGLFIDLLLALGKMPAFSISYWPRFTATL